MQRLKSRIIEIGILLGSLLIYNHENTIRLIWQHYVNCPRRNTPIDANHFAILSDFTIPMGVVYFEQVLFTLESFAHMCAKI